MDRYIEPEMSRCALITIDVQQDTLDGQPFEIAGTTAALPTIRALLRAFRKTRRPIVHIVRIYLSDGSNVDLCRREMVEQGRGSFLADSPGCELAGELLPEAHTKLDTSLLLTGKVQRIGPEEFVVYKPRWGAFYQTHLDELLRARNVSTLLFSGCNFPNCPRTSIYEASERDYRIVLVEDAISGLYDQGKREMAGIGVFVMSSSDVIREVNQCGSAITPHL